MPTEQNNAASAPSPPLARPGPVSMLLLSLGQFGWSLGSYALFNLLAYFYLPPEGAGFPVFIFRGAVLGVFTVIGLVGFGGRFYDGIIDALVANWSDRRASPTSKRRLPMGLAAVPLAVLAALVFFPIKSSEAAANGWWLAAVLLVFYFFFSLYTVPLTALMAEVSHDERDRVALSTAFSVAWSVGFLAGAQLFFIQNWLEKAGFPPVAAFQTAVVGFSVVGCVAMLAPVFFLKEGKIARQSPAAPGLRESLATIFGNANFRAFALADLTYWLALTFVQMGVPYFITVLLGMEKGRAATFLTAAAAGSALFYWPAFRLVGLFGKKKVMTAAFWSFAAVFALLGAAGWLPVSNGRLFWLLAAGAAYPLAAFGVVWLSLVTDIIFEEERQSGRQLAGMFFAARSFTMKVGVSLASLVFPSFLLLEKETGLRLAAGCAAAFCLVGLAFCKKYRAV